VAKANELRKGSVIRVDGELWLVTDAQHITPGNWRGYVQCKLKNLMKGNNVSRRFRSVDVVDDVYSEQRLMEYLYQDGTNYVFMDVETNEQTFIDGGLIADSLPYMAFNSRAKISICDGKPIGIELAPTVVLEVIETEQAAIGDTVSNVTKPATLETGLVVKVPAHINKGDRLKIDTRTGEFSGREQ